MRSTHFKTLASIKVHCVATSEHLVYMHIKPQSFFQLQYKVNETNVHKTFLNLVLSSFLERS